jgi:ABC-type xylose transport system permease subunit
MAVKALRPDDIRKWLPLATLAVLILLVGVAQPSFLQPGTLIGLASDTAVLFILATGVTFVIMLGGIDLSIQSMASLASVIVALTITRLGYGSFLLAIVIGAIAGFFSGTVHVRLKIPSFIATLAMGGVLFSAALVISKERSITLDETGRAYQAWITGQAFGLPNVIFIGLLSWPQRTSFRRIRGSAVTVQRSERESLRLTHLASRSAGKRSSPLCFRRRSRRWRVSSLRAALLAVRPPWLLSSCCLR